MRRTCCFNHVGFYDAVIDGENALGRFLRARRDRLIPRQASTGNSDAADIDQHVPGLGREEVADLAGVSVGYYTRLEQGREQHPSDQMLHVIAAALQLDAHTTEYLLELAGSQSDRMKLSMQEVSEELRELMDALVDTRLAEEVRHEFCRPVMIG